MSMRSRDAFRDNQQHLFSLRRACALCVTQVRARTHLGCRDGVCSDAALESELKEFVQVGPASYVSYFLLHSSYLPLLTSCVSYFPLLTSCMSYFLHVLLLACLTSCMSYFPLLTSCVPYFLQDVEPVIERMTELQKSVGLEDPRTP